MRPWFLQKVKARRPPRSCVHVTSSGSSVHVVHHYRIPLLWGIPASVTSFAEGEVGKLSDKYVGRKSTQGVGCFSGPCTSPGTSHHYTFVVIATDLDPKELPAGLTREQFLAKLAPPAPAPSPAK